MFDSGQGSGSGSGSRLGPGLAPGPVAEAAAEAEAEAEAEPEPCAPVRQRKTWSEVRREALAAEFSRAEILYAQVDSGSAGLLLECAAQISRCAAMACTEGMDVAVEGNKYALLPHMMASTQRRLADVDGEDAVACLQKAVVQWEKFLQAVPASVGTTIGAVREDADCQLRQVKLELDAARTAASSPAQQKAPSGKDKAAIMPPPPPPPPGHIAGGVPGDPCACCSVGLPMSYQTGPGGWLRSGSKTRAVRVRFQIICNARIEYVGKSQSCMVSKIRIIWKQTVPWRATAPASRPYGGAIPRWGSGGYRP